MSELSVLSPFPFAFGLPSMAAGRLAGRGSASRERPGEVERESSCVGVRDRGNDKLRGNRRPCVRRKRGLVHGESTLFMLLALSNSLSQ